MRVGVLARRKHVLVAQVVVEVVDEPAAVIEDDRGVVEQHALEPDHRVAPARAHDDVEHARRHDRVVDQARVEHQRVDRTARAAVGDVVPGPSRDEVGLGVRPVDRGRRDLVEP
jgi:hypothetical protein